MDFLHNVVCRVWYSPVTIFSRRIYLYIILKYNKLSKQRKEMIKQIQNTGGTWPPTYQTLANVHLQLFVKRIKSINFAYLQ